MGRLTGKVAIITGASKGMGADIAKAFAREDAAVVVNYATSREGADKVVAEINGHGGKAIAAQGNVANVGDIKRIFAETLSSFGGLNILVNNAGVCEFSPLENLTTELYTRLFNTNVLGTLLATREAVKLFGKKGVVELATVMGDYVMVGMVLTTIDQHLPPDRPARLPPR